MERHPLALPRRPLLGEEHADALLAVLDPGRAVELDPADRQVQGQAAERFGESRLEHVVNGGGAAPELGKRVGTSGDGGPGPWMRATRECDDRLFVATTPQWYEEQRWTVSS
jgi:hypothetical protein